MAELVVEDPGKVTPPMLWRPNGHGWVRVIAEQLAALPGDLKLIHLSIIEVSFIRTDRPSGQQEPCQRLQCLPLLVALGWAEFGPDDLGVSRPVALPSRRLGSARTRVLPTRQGSAVGRAERALAGPGGSGYAPGRRWDGADRPAAPAGLGHPGACPSGEDGCSP